MTLPRSRLIAVLLTFITTLGFSWPVHATDFVLRLHTWVSPQSADFRHTLLPWIKRVENASEGRIRIDVYPSMSLGGEPSKLFAQVRDGEVDIVWTRPGFTGKQLERLEAFELPFILTDPEAVSKAYWEYVQAYAADALDGLHLLALHVGGPTIIHTRGHPVSTIASMKNLRLSVPTRQAAKLLAALGAKPVMLPDASTLSALTERAIDGVLAPWDDAADAGLNEQSMYHTIFGPPALNATTHMLAINPKRYQSLPSELKKALTGDGGLQTSAQLGNSYKTRSQHQMATFRSNHLVTVSAEETQVFRKAAASVEAQWVKKVTADGFDGQKLLDGARTLIRQHTN